MNKSKYFIIIAFDCETHPYNRTSGLPNFHKYCLDDNKFAQTTLNCSMLCILMGWDHLLEEGMFWHTTVSNANFYLKKHFSIFNFIVSGPWGVSFNDFQETQKIISTIKRHDPNSKYSRYLIVEAKGGLLRRLFNRRKLTVVNEALSGGLV